MHNHNNLCFPLTEYKRRITELRNRMIERQLDAVIINDPANLLYLTGYQTTGYSYFQTLIVPIEKEPFMVTRLLEESNIFARTWVELSRPYTDTGDAIETLRQAIYEFELQSSTIGYEKDCSYFHWNFQQRLHASFTETTFVDCSGIVEQGRICKSDEEITIMQKAAKVTEAGMEAGIKAVQPGITENDLAAEIHYAMYKTGGEYPAVSPYITSGSRTLIGHATWEGREIEPNECVFLEIGGCYRRYHTAMMRTVFTGQPPDEMYAAEEAVKKAIQVVLDEVKVGMTIAELDALARSTVTQAATSGQLITRSGYSIGIAFAPSWDEGHLLSLKPGENTPIKENMTFHLIPWLYGVLDKYVMGLSETIRITHQGAESFFNFPRKLFLK